MNHAKAAADSGGDLLSGLRDIAGLYDAFIIDIWGVIHDGIRPFTGTIPCLQALKEKNKAICLLSNTPALGEDIIKSLDQMGISRFLYDHILTAGDSARLALKKYQGQKCWFSARMEYCGALIEGQDLTILGGPEGADFILNAISVTYDTDDRAILAQLDQALEMGLPMICANPDLVVNVGNEQRKCAGTYALYYEERGGQVEYHGKPHRPVYETCHRLLGHPDKSKILAIGDSFRTDIAGAGNFGVDSVINLIGIHWEEIRSPEAPDIPDLEKLNTMIETKHHKPDYMMAGFSW